MAKVNIREELIKRYIYSAVEQRLCYRIPQKDKSKASGRPVELDELIWQIEELLR